MHKVEKLFLYSSKGKLYFFFYFQINVIDKFSYIFSMKRLNPEYFNSADAIRLSAVISAALLEEEETQIGGFATIIGIETILRNLKLIFNSISYFFRS